MAHQPVVAIVNSNPDLASLLKRRLEKERCVVVMLPLDDLQHGLDVHDAVAQYDPAVIVYDLAAPYQQSQLLLQHLRKTAFRGRQIVLTTPNADGLPWEMGAEQTIYEILNDERDIDAIVEAVQEAVGARAAAR